MSNEDEEGEIEECMRLKGNEEEESKEVDEGHLNKE